MQIKLLKMQRSGGRKEALIGAAWECRCLRRGFLWGRGTVNTRVATQGRKMENRKLILIFFFDLSKAGLEHSSGKF